MKKCLMILFFCLPVPAQSVYSGQALDSGTARYGASACGPGNGYACFVQDVDVHNFAMPGPNWGPNTCDWTSMATASTCGNLIGANTIQTPLTFGSPMIRCTDMNTIRMDGGSVGPSPGNPAMIWTTYDSPSVNAWNTDDTGILLKTAGGTVYVMRFNPSTLQCSMTNPVIAFPATIFNGAIFSHLINNRIFSFSGTILQESTVNLAAGSISTTTKYDFNNPQCLTNSVNGYTGGSFPQNMWTGVMSASLDDTTFAMGFSTGPAQGSGVYAALWTVGQAGCDIYNTASGTITHNGTLLGSIPDAPWGGAYGGKADRFTIHSVGASPSNQWACISTSPNLMLYGSYDDGYYFWQKGTTNVQRCGIGAPSWKASTVSDDGDRVSPTTNNAGDYIFQIVGAGNAGTSGAAAPTWAQTPGQTNIDGSITWLNVGLDGSQQYFCDGHGWEGYNGRAVGKKVSYHSYANPIYPQTHLTNYSSVADQHFGSTNANSTDSSWIFAMSSDVGTAVNLITGPLPSALYDEGYLMAPPYKPDGSVNCPYDPETCPAGVGAVRRAFQNYNSGWHQTFDVQNGMCVLSPDGNFAICSTDGMGQFGSTSGATSCNVGAPDWVKSDSSDFSVGSNLFRIRNWAVIPGTTSIRRKFALAHAPPEP